MDEVVVLIALVLFIVFAPIILSIVALVKTAHMRDEINTLSRRITALSSRQGEVKKKPIEPEEQGAVEKQKAPAATQPTSPPSPKPVVIPKPESKSVAPSRPTPKPKTKPGLEFMLGGKGAAFAGVAILVMGIVFLVGYAVQHSWIGPGTRIVLGLLSGGVLVGFGHFVGRKDEKYTLFARVLTGGGSALFYFCVFAAYGIYHLISAPVAGAGLFVSALAVFGLSMVYHAQSVAILAVLGAFITPLLIDGDMETGIFPMVYIGLINVPVILLGVRRNWQGLYNLGFVFTVLHYCVWLDWVGDGELVAGLSFALLFFAEYVALGVLKLRKEQRVSGRTVDLIRLLLISVLLLAAVYSLLNEAELNQWIGASFLLLALLHVVLARAAFKLLSQFNGEILTFLAGGLLFATLALPAQLDGEWVSLGWALEGLVLSWFAVRVQSRVVQAGAFVLGLIGIMKALLFDVTLYVDAPNLFLNARFLVGLASAGLLGVQGKIAGKFPEDTASSNWQDVLWWVGVCSGLTIFFADVFWTLGATDAYSWLVTSIMLFATGVSVALFAPPKSSITVLASILLLLVPVKILMIDSLCTWDFGFYRSVEPFSYLLIWIQLIMIGVAAALLPPRFRSSSAGFVFGVEKYPQVLNLVSLVAGVGIITLEIMRKNTDWATMAVTIFWAISALVLILLGMKRCNRLHRYFGLVLFVLTTLKVLLVDSSGLNGLERIAAFMGTGILLLALSFAYQKASAYFHAQEEK